MSQTLRVTVVIALYLLLNSSLNMLNKWALASFFPFPLLLTTVHMVFSFVVRLEMPKFATHFGMIESYVFEPFLYCEVPASHDA